MSELLPTRQAQSIEEGLLDYLTTTFALADDDARPALLEFLSDRQVRNPARSPGMPSFR